MMNSCIVILTTDGPCYINGLAVDSMLQENNGPSVAKTPNGSAYISNKYHDFVSLEHGVITRRTGQGGYRLKLSRDINHGNSWQLGVFCAHLLVHGNHPLTTKDYQHLIITSGMVDTSADGDQIMVTPIKALDTKLQHIQNIINIAHQGNVAISLILPYGNCAEALEICDQLQITSLLTLRPVKNATDIENSLKASFNQQIMKPSVLALPSRQWLWLLVLLLFIGVAIGNYYSQWGKDSLFFDHSVNTKDPQSVLLPSTVEPSITAPPDIQETSVICDIWPARFP